GGYITALASIAPGRASTPPATGAHSQSADVPQSRDRLADNAPAASASGSATPLRRSRWEEMLGQLAARMPAKSSLLERANFGEKSTTASIVLQFDKSDSFTAGQLRDRVTVNDLQNFFGEIMGHPVQLTVEICDLGDQSTLAQKKLKTQEALRKVEDAAKNHPLIRGFETALGGKISKVRLNR
ncbi:MAG: hypothetical protein JXX14_06575, partial [Deltaproteobacteria bacterium]|nr:hypothetical protein [Deltaproteobacteria bacterium]